MTREEMRERILDILLHLWFHPSDAPKVNAALTRPDCEIIADKLAEAILEEKEKVCEFNCQSVDAVVWAKEFVKIYNKHYANSTTETPAPILIDEDLMRGWFASAIMAGYDEAKRKLEAQPHRPKEIEKLGNVKDSYGHYSVLLVTEMNQIIDKINEIISQLNRGRE